MANMISGSSHSTPLIALLGNIACGNEHQDRRSPTAEAMKATSIASQTTQTCGLSVVRKLLGEAALEPERRELRRELDDQITA